MKVFNFLGLYADKNQSKTFTKIAYYFSGKNKSTIECKKQMLNQLKKIFKLGRSCTRNSILPPLMQKEKLSS